MNDPRTVRVLVVTDHTDIDPALLELMSNRAARGPVQFRVLLTNPAKAEVHALHPERHVRAHEAEKALRAQLPSMELAVGAPVLGSVSVRHDPYLAVEELIASEPVEEFIVALSPHGLSRRLHLDLPHRLARLHLPIATIELVSI